MFAKDLARGHVLLTLLLALSLVTSAAFAASTPLRGDWWMSHHDAQHTGLSTIAGPTAPVCQWAFTTVSQVTSSPAIGADGTIYVGSYDWALYAVNPDGTLKWAFPTGNGIASSPAIGTDGTIYVGSLDGALYAVNPNGTAQWAAPFVTGGAIASSPVIGTDGTIYVGSEDNKLYAVNANGTAQWAAPFVTGGAISSSPALGTDGTIYIGSSDNKLYAIKADGTAKWTAPFVTGGAIESSPAIGADGTIYVGSDDANFYAVNPDGTQQWVFADPWGAAFKSTPALGTGVIYVGAMDGGVYALNANGTKLWVFDYPNGKPYDSSPAVGADGVIYIGSEDNNLFALNPDGSLKWSYPTGGAVESSPAIGANGTIYFGSDDNNLYAISQGAAPYALKFSTQPVLAETGNALTPALTVSEVDANGVSLFAAATPITLALGTNPGGATLGGTLTQDAVGGVATFSDLTLNQVGVGDTLTASATGCTGAVSNAFTVIASLSAVNVTSAPLSPQTVNTPILLTASATGGMNVQYKFWVYNAAATPAWSQLQAYSTSATCLWTPTTDGNCLLAISARDGLLGTEVTTTTWYTVTSLVPLTAVSLSMAPASPQQVNTPILLTASVTGGGANVQYQFWAYCAAATPAWFQLQGYSSSATCSWTPATVGNYLLSVTARDGVTGIVVNTTQWYTVLLTAPLTAVSVAAAPASPQLVQTLVTFSASATGGSNVQYKFWLYNAAASPAWSQLQGYSTSATCSWVPSMNGNNLLSVTARDGASGVEVNTMLWYTVTGLTLSLTSSPLSPQPVNTPITLTASAAGGTSIQYQFWLYNAAANPTWSQLQGYSTSATCLWTPTADGTYLLSVTARDGVTGTTVNTMLWYTICNLALTVTPSVQSPQPANTAITLTASATGGTSIQYQFWLYNAAANPAWSQLQGFSTTATCLWTPTADGTYLLSVTAQDSATGSTVNTMFWYTVQ